MYGLVVEKFAVAGSVALSEGQQQQRSEERVSEGDCVVEGAEVHAELEPEERRLGAEKLARGCSRSSGFCYCVSDVINAESPFGDAPSVQGMRSTFISSPTGRREILLVGFPCLRTARLEHPHARASFMQLSVTCARVIANVGVPLASFASRSTRGEEAWHESPPFPSRWHPNPTASTAKLGTCQSVEGGPREEVGSHVWRDICVEGRHCVVASSRERGVGVSDATRTRGASSPTSP
jgi:hypothetical protein